MTIAFSANNDGLSGQLQVGGSPVMSFGADTSGQLAGFRNRIINGGMAVAQRPTYTTTTSSGQWIYGGADRMVGAFTGTSGSSTLTRYNGNPTSTGGAQGMSSTTLTGSGCAVYIGQRIESVNTFDLNSSQVTISMTAYQNTGSAVNAQLILCKPSVTLNDFSTVTQLGASNSISIPNLTWTRISYTCSLGSTSASLGLWPYIQFNCGAVSSKDFIVSDFQMEKGSIMTPFEFRPYHVELAACQRYLLTVPNGNWFASGTLRTGGTNSYVFIPCPVSMRVAPTVSGPITAYCGDTNASATLSGLGYSSSGFTGTATHTTIGSNGGSVLLISNGGNLLMPAEL